MIGRETVLRFDAERIAFTLDECETNAVTFIEGDKSFFLSAATALDEDPILNQIYSEIDGQENGRDGAIARLAVRVVRGGPRRIVDHARRPRRVRAPGEQDLHRVDPVLGDRKDQRRAAVRLVGLL